MQTSNRHPETDIVQALDQWQVQIRAETEQFLAVSRNLHQDVAAADLFHKQVSGGCLGFPGLLWGVGGWRCEGVGGCSGIG